MLPWPEELVREWRDAERGRRPREEALEAEERWIQRWVRFQRRRGFWGVFVPMQRWLDLFRPFALADGLAEGGLARFLETNTFYRRLRVEDRPRWGAGLPVFLEQFLRAPPGAREVRKLVVPGIWSLACAMEGPEDEQRIRWAAALLREALGRKLRRLRGPVVIQVQEPFLFSERPTEWWELLAEEYALLETLAPVLLHSVFQPSVEGWEALLRLPVSGFGVDASGVAPADLAHLPWKDGALLYAGLRDVRRLDAPRETWIRRWLREARKHWKPAGVILSYNGDPEFLPARVFVSEAERWPQWAALLERIWVS